MTTKINFKRIFLFIFLCVYGIHLQAQSYNTTTQQLQNAGLGNGTWLYDTDFNWYNFIEAAPNYYTTYTKSAIPNNSNNLYSINIDFEDDVRFWDARIRMPLQNLVSAGEELLVVFWAKGISDERGNYGGVHVFNKSGEKDEPLAFIPFESGWKQYRIPFTARANEEHVELRFGFLDQNFEIGAMTIIKYPQSTNLEPVRMDASLDYESLDENPALKASLNNGIEQNRKADLTVIVKDVDGDLIHNANVSVIQQEHDFDFGIAEKLRLLTGGSETTYKNLFRDDLKLNLMCFESDLLWQNYYFPSGANTNDPAKLCNIANWVKAKNIEMRWHNVLWPTNAYIPTSAKNKLSNGDINGFIEEAKDFIDDILGQGSCLSDVIEEIDVINEPAFNRLIEDQTDYYTSLDVFKALFDYIDANWSDKQLYINEYVALDYGGYSHIGSERFKRIVGDLNGRVDALGFQAHMKYAVSPQEIKTILDDYSNEFGKEIKITEFDFYDIDESIQADYFEDFLTTIFAHPNVNGFQIWDGIKDNPNWNVEGVPLFDANGNLKPTTGQRFKDLVFDEWWTNESKSTNTNGNATIRAFKGEHTVTASYAGVSNNATVSLNGDNEVVITLNVDVPSNNNNDDTCDIIENGNYDNGKINWEPYIRSNVDASWNTNNGYASWNINYGGSAIWHLQHIQPELNLESGTTYKLRFRARADNNKYIYVKCSNAQDNNDSGYLKEYLTVGTAWQDYEYTFTMNQNDASARLNFGIGANSTDIHIDDVSLVKVGCSNTNPEDCNVLQNASFDDGTNGWSPYFAGGANASINTNLGYVKYTINNGGTQNWHVQLYQKNIDIDDGETYLISFLVKANSNKNINVNLSKATSPFNAYYSESVPISTQWERKYFIYESNINDPSARLVFNLGKNTGEINIDDIVVKKVSCFGANMVENAYFQENFNVGWEVPYINSSAAATFTSNDDGVVCNITDDGSKAWHIQHLQKGMNIEAGATYTISFKGKATSNRSILVEVSDANAPHTGYLYKYVNLNTTLKTHHITFTANQSNPNARLAFNMGNNSANVTLDDIVFVKEIDTDYRIVTTNTPITDLPKINIGPNPFDDILNIHIENNEQKTGTYTLYNLQGRLLQQAAIEANTQTIQLPTTTLENGIYILKITVGDMIITRKLVK